MKKKYYSFSFGLIIFLYGLYALANNYFSVLPQLSFILATIPMELLIVIGGSFLLYCSFSVSHGSARIASIIAGLILFLLGLFPLLMEFRWIYSKLPFVPILKINILLLGVILLFYGIFLMLDSFIMD